MAQTCGLVSILSTFRKLILPGKHAPQAQGGTGQREKTSCIALEVFEKPQLITEKFVHTKEAAFVLLKLIKEYPQM